MSLSKTLLLETHSSISCLIPISEVGTISCELVFSRSRKLRELGRARPCKNKPWTSLHSNLTSLETESKVSLHPLCWLDSCNSTIVWIGIPESPWISKVPQVIRTSSGVTESYWTTLLGNARLNHLADQVNHDLEYLFWRPKIHKLRNEAKIIHLNTTSMLLWFM